jgi:hypothetical protein
MVRDTVRHRGSHPQRLVNPNQIVMREVQAERKPVNPTKLPGTIRGQYQLPLARDRETGAVISAFSITSVALIAPRGCGRIPLSRLATHS